MSTVGSEGYLVELELEHEHAVAEEESRSGHLRDSRGRVTSLIRGAAKRPGAVIAGVYVLLVLLCAVAPSLLAGYGGNQIDATDFLKGMSIAHPFGTDNLGRDLLSRMIYSCGPSVVGMLVAVGIATVGGLSLGVVSGFMGGWIDAVLMRAVDVMLAIPGLLLALAIVTAIGFGTVHVSIAVGVGIIPGFARITRAQVLQVRSLPYVEASRTSGASLSRVLWRHVLPNSWQPVAVLIVLDFGTAILSIAALSFLGFGPQPPSTDLGTLVSNGRNYLETAPWLALWPGVAVGLLVFAMNHLAKTMEEVQR